MNADLSISNLIILLGAVQGIFLSAVIGNLTRQNKTAHRFLALFLFIFALQMIAFVIWDSHFILKVPHLSMITSPLNFALGPLYFLYVKALTSKDFSLKRKDALHFVPFLVSIIYFIPFYFKSAAYKIQFNLDSDNHFPAFWSRFSVVATIQSSIYIVLTILILVRHERTVKKYYSSLEKKNLGWIRANVFAMVLTWLSCSFFSFFGWKWADYYSNIVFSACVYALGYYGIRQQFIFNEIREDVETEEPVPAVIKPEEIISKKYERSGLTEDKAKQLLIQLDKLMAAEKLFLNPELNLQQLADTLSSSSGGKQVSIHHVSQVLNQYKQLNFFDYINQLRVEEFKIQLLDPSKQHLSLLGLAFECGFNSKASFNVAFKKYTGTTPSAFRKNLSIETA